MKKILIISSVTFAFGLSLGALMTRIYYKNVEAEYITQREKAYSEALENKAKVDRENREKIAEIEKDNYRKLEKEKADYEKQLVALRKNFNPRDTIRIADERVCDKGSGSDNGMSGQSGNSGELVCYEKSELQDKIARTLAIGSECDRIAIDYNSLLETR